MSMEDLIFGIGAMLLGSSSLPFELRINYRRSRHDRNKYNNFSKASVLSSSLSFIVFLGLSRNELNHDDREEYIIN